MPIRVRDAALHSMPIHTRMPFRYGIATMTALLHLFVHVRLDVDGRETWGVAADSLVPKWFDKNPHTSFAQDTEAMLAVVKSACRLAQEAPPAPTVFDLWLALYQAQKAWAEAKHPPLLWGFGVSLVERAMIDAFCRITGTPFAHAVRANTLGLRLDAIHPELAGHVPADFLPSRPLDHLTVRHTVGLSDPIRDEDIPQGERLDDGLPQSLAGCMDAYGLTHFKIKIGGHPAADRERLAQIGDLLQARGREYWFTLDGNESYACMEDFRAFWASLEADPGLEPFLGRLLWVEQPVHRDAALAEETGAALHAWRDHPPIIIDESDGELASLPTALARGYAGTSHKNCKGVFKSLANACLLGQRSRETGRPAVLSGEDLSTIGPVALLQDLAVLASLGLPHAERNGHHYFAGLSMFPAWVQEQALRHHGDLYCTHTTPDGRTFPTLHIRRGRIALDSVVAAPFGAGCPKWAIPGADAPG